MPQVFLGIDLISNFFLILYDDCFCYIAGRMFETCFIEMPHAIAGVLYSSSTVPYSSTVQCSLLYIQMNIIYSFVYYTGYYCLLYYGS